MGTTNDNVLRFAFVVTAIFLSQVSYQKIIRMMCDVFQKQGDMLSPLFILFDTTATSSFT